MKLSSKRCGKIYKCEHGDSSNIVSGCKIYEDRNLCSISRKQRKKSAQTSRQRSIEQIRDFESWRKSLI